MRFFGNFFLLHKTSTSGDWTLAFWDFKFGQKLAEIFTTLYDSAQGIHLELKKIVCY